MNETNGIIALIFFCIGAFAVFLVFLAARSHNHLDSEYIEQCQAACESNGGLSKIYLSSDCECINGAVFDRERLEQ